MPKSISFGKSSSRKKQSNLSGGWLVALLLGLLLVMPFTTQAAGPVIKTDLIADTNFSGEQGLSETTLQNFLDTQPGLFKTYQENSLGAQRKASEVLMLATQQEEFTLNPLVILSLYQVRYNVLDSVTNQDITGLWSDYVKAPGQLNDQVAEISYRLQRYYDSAKAGQTIKLKDGTVVHTDPGLNRSSLAILSFLAEFETPAEWNISTGNSSNSFRTIYGAMKVKTTSSIIPTAGPGRFLQHPRKDQNTGINAQMDHDQSSGILDYKGSNNTYDGHAGTDYSANYVDFYAAADGAVEASVDNYGSRPGWCPSWASWNVPERYVIIKHANGYRTKYWHLSVRSVSQGATVHQGDKIGTTGNSGCTSGPHAHFEVADTSNNPTDPYGYCANSNRSDPWKVADYWLWSDANSPCAQQNPDTTYSVGQGSTRQSRFIEAYNRKGGQASMGNPTDAAHWWSSSDKVVAQDFSGHPDVIMQDENWEDTHNAPVGTCAAFTMNGGISDYYKSHGGPDTFGAPTSDEYMYNGLYQNSFTNGYISWSDTPTFTPWSTTTNSGWRKEYYNNTSLSCGLSWVEFENNLNFDYNWNGGTPMPGILTSDWSAEYNRYENIAAGNYTIWVGADDGVRMWLDGNLLFDNWDQHPFSVNSWTGNISGGTHQLQIKYYQLVGPDRLSFSMSANSFSVGQSSSYPQNFIDAFNQGGGTAILGNPIDSVKQYENSGVYWQPFNGNVSATPAIFYHQAASNTPSNIRAFVINGGIYQYYMSIGGPSSWLGAPTSDLIDSSTTSSPLWIVNFVNGYIQWDSSGNHQTIAWPTSFAGWKAQYFNNNSLQSGPSLVRNEGDSSTPNFSYDWGSQPPLPKQGLTFAEQWSAQWERNWTFAPGSYQYTLCGDDGVKLYLAGTVVLNQWQHQNYNCFTYIQSYSTTTTVPVKIQYYQDTGNAKISFSVAPVDTSLQVSNSVDTGNATTTGTLSYALQHAANGQSITFAPGITTITIKGTLPALASGASIQGSCTSPVEISGTDPAAPPVGLTLSGNNSLMGLWVHGFKSKQLNMLGTGIRMICMKVSVR